MYDTDKNPKIGDLRVYHIPQVPMKSFRIPVDSVEEGRKIIVILADYDLFQYENNVKGDYCNTSGLEVYEADNGDGVPGWCEWYNEDTGETVSENRGIYGTFSEPPTLDALVSIMKHEITADIAEMRIPHNVSSYSDLHDYVDANCYGGFCEDDAHPWAWKPEGGLTDAATDLINAATDIVDKWLANGRKE